jgi:SAM-dependent methyltransferase
MIQIPDMSVRFFEPEIMDNITGPEDELFGTLRQFVTVNRLFSRTRTIVKQYLIPRMAALGDREIVVADLGAGGCDFALWFTRILRRRGIKVRMLCIDHDPRVVRYAKNACKSHNDIEIIEASAFSIDTINGPIDYIFSNHFLHHIESSEIPGLLAKIHTTARRGFLISDLARSAAAYVGFTTFCRVFFRSNLSCHDGRLSIRKGFLKDELAGIVAQASLGVPVAIRTMHPGRIFFFWFKNE